MTKIHFITQGCSLNHSDTEVMKGILNKFDYEIVNTLDEADLVIINSCTVKNPTEHKMYKFIKEAEEKNKKIIIAGCIAQTDKNLKKYSLLGTHQIDRITEVVEHTLDNEIIQIIEEKNNKRLNLPKIRKNKIIEIIPIAKGCLGYPCAYCKTKQARGDLISYKKEDIIKQINDALKEDVKEIWLTAQDTGAYGIDINETLTSLLKEILNIKKDFKVRLGMANPEHIKKNLEEITEILKHEKMFKFVHLPIQSGDDRIINLMRRKYTGKDFINIVKYLKKEIPEITIATDIIVGFPTETDEEFNNTLKVIKKTNPDVINISKFWARPGTEAALMKQLPGEIIKERSNILTNIFREIAKKRNKEWINKECIILLDEEGKNNTILGRNDSYKLIGINKDNHKLGDTVEIKINKSDTYYLKGILTK